MAGNEVGKRRNAGIQGRGTEKDGGHSGFSRVCQNPMPDAPKPSIGQGLESIAYENAELGGVRGNRNPEAFVLIIIVIIVILSRGAANLEAWNVVRSQDSQNLGVRVLSESNARRRRIGRL